MANESGPQTPASGIESSVGRVATNRPVWGIVLGVLVILAGLVVLSHVIVATVVSVIFLGWFAVLGGLAGVVASLFRLGKPGFWPTLLGGALALAVGVAFLRRPGLSAAALTLLLGAMLWSAGGPGSSGGSASTTSTAVGSSPTASSRCCSGCSSCSGGRARPCGCWARSSVLT